MNRPGAKWLPGDGPERFNQARPELVPLAPVADHLMYVTGGVKPARQRAERLVTAWSELNRARDLARDVYPSRTPAVPEGTFEVLGDMVHDADRFCDLQDAAVEHIESFGLDVERDTGRIKVPVSRPGKNPTLLTFAAGMVWESLNVDGYRARTGDMTDVPETLAEKVSERLWPMWVDPNPTRGPRRRGDLDPGRNSRLRRALRSYVADPDRYHPDLLPL